ncbi:MAG: hypothetical protein ACP5US_07035 [Candidatus Kryptoniota bacterium]
MDKKRFPEIFYNMTSVVGAAIAFVSFGIIVLLMVIDLFWKSFPPYFGLVTYILMPSVLILGLIIIPIGALIQRRRLHRQITGQEKPPFPKIDLNDNRQRAAFFSLAQGHCSLSF